MAISADGSRVAVTGTRDITDTNDGHFYVYEYDVGEGGYRDIDTFDTNMSGDGSRVVSMSNDGGRVLVGAPDYDAPGRKRTCTSLPIIVTRVEFGLYQDVPLFANTSSTGYGRYVVITRPNVGSGTYLRLAEVEVYDNSFVNVALNKPVWRSHQNSSKSTHSVPSKLTDGNKYPYFSNEDQSDGIVHTLE